jgi:hypothetical protein
MVGGTVILSRTPDWNHRPWRKLIEVFPEAYNLRTIQNFWLETLKILDSGEEEASQNIARDLTNRDLFGYQHIEAIMEIDPTQHNILEYAQPFLLVISHTALLNCTSIKPNVNDLFEIIYGDRRGLTFLTNVCNAILADFESNARMYSMEKYLVATTIVLCEVVSHEKKQVHFSDRMSHLLNLIERILLEAQILEQSSSYNLVANRVQRLKRKFCHLEIVGTEKARVKASLTGTFGQHDRPDLTKLEILPTYADIRKIQREAFPSFNFDKPCFSAGVERLIDFHFRLLRHDSLGTVEKQLSKLLRMLREDPNVDVKSSKHLNFEKEGFFVYDNVYIQRLLFDQRCGLQAQLCFRSRQSGSQQRSKRGLGVEERRTMQPGSLICLVTTHVKMRSIVFFTVSAAKGPPGISSDHQHTTVMARIAEEESQKRVDHLLQLTWQRKGVRSILVEFPEVLLPTFIPVLKNLQQMQRESRLPFQQWIVPQSHLKTPIDILPPLYARATGFFFSLRNLLINKAEDFKLRPNDYRNDFRLLESRTTLDQGQCEAIITALTQEFALIRGPPGTGKSYIGLQLVKALLENKSKAQLGPIIILYDT